MNSNRGKKNELYSLVRIWGLVSFIPVVLAAGPIAGYFLGEQVEKKVGFAPYVSLFCVAIGFVAAAMEVIKIVKVIYKADKQS
ncbi:MAG: AtpZ/AtpI family protein [Candidatus Omnitrophota bacterium]